MGLGIRAQKLASAASLQANDKEKGKKILDAAERLVDPNGMGGQYKFMGVCTRDLQGEDENVEARRSSLWPFGFGRQ